LLGQDPQPVPLLVGSSGRRAGPDPIGLVHSGRGGGEDDGGVETRL